MLDVNVGSSNEPRWYLSMQSTENMEMMTQLQGEQHIAKELAARLGHQEEELKELRHQVHDSNKLFYCGELQLLSLIYSHNCLLHEFGYNVFEYWLPLLVYRVLILMLFWFHCGPHSRCYNKTPVYFHLIYKLYHWSSDGRSDLSNS